MPSDFLFSGFLVLYKHNLLYEIECIRAKCMYKTKKQYKYKRDVLSKRQELYEELLDYCKNYIGFKLRF